MAGMGVLYIPVKILLLNMLRSFCFIFDVLEQGSFPYPLYIYSIAFLLVVFLVCVIIANNVIKLLVRFF